MKLVCIDNKLWYSERGIKTYFGKLEEWKTYEGQEVKKKYIVNWKKKIETEYTQFCILWLWTYNRYRFAPISENNSKENTIDSYIEDLPF